MARRATQRNPKQSTLDSLKRCTTFSTLHQSVYTVLYRFCILYSKLLIFHSISILLIAMETKNNRSYVDRTAGTVRRRRFFVSCPSRPVSFRAIKMLVLKCDISSVLDSKINIVRIFEEQQRQRVASRKRPRREGEEVIVISDDETDGEKPSAAKKPKNDADVEIAFQSDASDFFSSEIKIKREFDNVVSFDNNDALVSHEDTPCEQTVPAGLGDRNDDEKTAELDDAAMDVCVDDSSDAAGDEKAEQPAPTLPEVSSPTNGPKVASSQSTILENASSIYEEQRDDSDIPQKGSQQSNLLKYTGGGLFAASVAAAVYFDFQSTGKALLSLMAPAVTRKAVEIVGECVASPPFNTTSVVATVREIWEDMSNNTTFPM